MRWHWHCARHDRHGHGPTRADAVHAAAAHVGFWARRHVDCTIVYEQR